MREKPEIHNEEPVKKEWNTKDIVNPINPVTITISAIGAVGKAITSLVPTLP